MTDARAYIDDERRLAALHDRDIANTDPEPGFDDIVQIAATLCGTPIALVTMIDRETQWFKARFGTDIDRTPADIALCANAFGHSEMLVIPDLTRDDRTRENPLVTGDLALRFYGGVPLVTGEGHMLGTLCVIDTEPHPNGLGDAQRTAMAALGRQVMALVEMRRTVSDRDDTVSALAERTKRFLTAEAAGRIGTFDIDVNSDVMATSPEFCRIFGLSPVTSIATAAITALVVDGDDVRHSSERSRADGTADLEVEYRIRRADTGKVRWIARRAKFERAADGTATHMYGTVEDITERRQIEDRMRALHALGDRLRDARSIAAIAAVAAETLGATLVTARACYAEESDATGDLAVTCQWTDGDAPAISCESLSTALPATVRRLHKGVTVAIANVKAADWVDEDRAGYAEMHAAAVIAVPLNAPGERARALLVHDREGRTWQPAEIEFVQGVADRIHAEIAKLDLEAERQVLTQELSHRLKNTLTMVQALASQTLKHVPDRAPVQAFEQRLSALSAAHEVLLRQSWAASRIDAVAAEVLATLGQINRIDIGGPDVTLGSRAALSLSLVLHELGTNALKYGALSVEGGRVVLEWHVDGEGEDAVLSVDWKERGGPAPQEPTRKGFGSRLINMGLLGTGGVETRFPISGFEATFTAGLRRAQRT